MQLVTQVIDLPNYYSVTEEAESVRNEIALSASKVTSVTTAAQNEQAANAVRIIRLHVKEVEDMRQKLTRPLLEGQRLLKALSDDHCAPLLEQKSRLERLAVGFSQAEARRVQEEERIRQAEFRKAEEARLKAEKEAAEKAAKADRASATTKDIKAASKAEEKVIAAEAAVQAVIAAPLPEVSKSRGQQTKKVMCFEVTDLNALVAARPDLCKIEAKASAINAVCKPDMVNVPPGLRLWYEDRVVFTNAGGML
jgi:DNA polymerase III alpha subunit (gram-positive type)